jgi:hypothetical protein
VWKSMLASHDEKLTIYCVQDCEFFCSANGDSPTTKVCSLENSNGIHGYHSKPQLRQALRENQDSHLSHARYITLNEFTEMIGQQ